ncbi:MAG: carboxypeptidase-like regulatory domain-containing protein [Mucilaginibacter sp.]|uniref:carboxypeptidase-like regulatory domain-containing protein n=1 Tax=Mucilaginibacter sp. TaxID=1882438 RepID=UPI0034E51310
MEKLYIVLFKHAFGKYKREFVLLINLLLMVAPAVVFSQSGRMISGTVTDEKNQPLPGVSVLVIGTTNGVASDMNGKYSINVNSNTSVLRFTSVGFTTKEIPVGNQNTINVSLLPNSQQLKDVVVIGYGTSTKQDVTGAITSLKSEDFNQGVLTTPAELLQGKVPGLNVTKSGDPNQALSVILRGPSTIRTSAQEPFYVIDGVPGTSIDLLAPADIESIDVLKDASSTAIYGSRAANGVIIITTKRAKLGQTRLAYSSYAAVDEV